VVWHGQMSSMVHVVLVVLDSVLVNFICDIG